MISTRPYLIRAFYEWISDSGWTPYIMVNAETPGAEVPYDFVEDGKIIFNISTQAIRDLHISNRQLEFDANFSSQNMWVRVPINAILAVYARENGRGLVFEAEEELATDIDENTVETPAPEIPTTVSTYSKEPRKPKLTIVKSE